MDKEGKLVNNLFRFFLVVSLVLGLIIFVNSLDNRDVKNDDYAQVLASKTNLPVEIIYEKVDGEILNILNNEVKTISPRIMSDEVSEIEIKAIISLRDDVFESDARENSIEEIGIEKVKHIYSQINSYSATISLEDLEKLIIDNNVEKIYYDYPVEVHLNVDAPNRSVDIINARDVWNYKDANGFNLTGKGQTVCVIDTGIDFTHPDLFGRNLTCNIDCYYANCIPNCSLLDTNGHGTHVAGIVGAYGGINGTAIEANLIGVNVFSTGGSTTDISYVEKGIKWCITNSEQYNISVISLSLGTDCDYFPHLCHSNYCNSDFLAGSINDATSKNLSIVISTGNNGNSTHVSSPSCIQNATRVGSTTKTEAISSFSNRWGLDMLMAPGSSINSTYLSGNYASMSGTSMSAPHVSGAVAIVNQYLDSINITMNPKEIEEILNNTGDIVEDSTRNFSRINLKNALEYISIPEISIVYPNNFNHTNKNLQNFSCKYYGIAEAKNITFSIWNSSGDLIHNESKDISGNENTTMFEYGFEEEGVYNWTCETYNILNIFNQAENRTIIFDQTAPEIIMNSPQNESFTRRRMPNFNFNVTDNFSDNLSCNLTINNSLIKTLNAINDTENIFQSDRLISGETYEWKISCVDLAGNTNSSEIKIIKIDSVPPTTTINFSESKVNEWFNSPVLVNFSVTDNFSGVNKTEWKNSSDGEWIEFNISEGISLSENLSDNLIYFRSIDNARNVEITRQEIFNYDDSPPIIEEIKLSTAKIKTNSFLQIRVKASDDLSGISNVTLRFINSSEEFEPDYILEFSEGYYFASVLSPEDEGEYNLSISVRDNARNLVTNNSTSLEVNDSLFYFNTNLINESIIRNNTNLIINFSILEELSINYSVNGEENYSNQPLVLNLFSENDETITVEFNASSNSSGELEWINDTLVFYVNETKPFINFSEYSGNENVNGTIILRTTSEHISGIKNISLFINEELYKTKSNPLYEFYYPTRLLDNGLANFTLLTYNNLGVSNSTTIELNISNFNKTFNVSGDYEDSLGFIGYENISGTEFESTFFCMNNLNQSEINLSFINVSNLTANQKPSSAQLSKIVEAISIQADTGDVAKIYVLIPLLKLSEIKYYENISFYHDDDGTIEKIESYAYEKNITLKGIEYALFWFETESFSNFFWGIQGEESETNNDDRSSGGGGGGGGGVSGQTAGPVLPLPIVEEKMISYYNYRDFLDGKLINLSNNEIVILTIGEKNYNLTIENILEEQVMISLKNSEVIFNKTFSERESYSHKLNENYEIELVIIEINENVSMMIRILEGWEYTLSEEGEFVEITEEEKLERRIKTKFLVAIVVVIIFIISFVIVLILEKFYPK